MKIAFITGCLEHGRDGVGDYTRSLAQECRRQGHDVILIALHDTAAVPETVVAGVPELRLDRTAPWNTRVQLARERIDRFQPDWISLQFVSYAYNKKGIILGLIDGFEKLTGGYRLHLMFHELWIGHWKDATLRHRLVGSLQKFLIKRLLKRLKPRVITSTNPLYVHILREHGFSSVRLPLFSSIPIAHCPSNDWFYEELGRRGINLNARTRNDWWLFGIFGSVHPNWPTEKLCATLRDAAVRHQRKILVLSIGRIGPGRELWSNLTAQNCELLQFVELGENSIERLSSFMQTVDFAIATTPLPVIGKSSSAVALIEHGLPLIVNSDKEDTRLAGCPLDPQVYPLRPDLDLSKLQRLSPQSKLPEIARTFVELLSPECKSVQRTLVLN